MKLPFAIAIVLLLSTAAHGTDVPTNCQDPKDVGRGRAALNRFYFDKDANQCKAFVWGGGLPNGNNFETMEACQRACVR